MKVDFSNKEHRVHCRKAKCGHPAIHDFGDFKSQGWCARCRAVAFGGVYEGLAYINGAIVHVGKGASA